MKRVLFITFSLLLSLSARENPFFPSPGERDLPFTSNSNKSFDKLKRVSVPVPEHARVIKQVTIKYQNLDGSIEERSISLNNSIDWHIPIFVSQSFAEEATNKITTQIPNRKFVKKSSIKKKGFTQVAQTKYAKFSIDNHTLKIKTQDKLLRYFLIAQPHRIVMDFKKDSSLKTYVKKIKDSVFKKVTIGNHKGYYRVVLELDGYYRYKLKILNDGCLINLQ